LASYRYSNSFPHAFGFRNAEGRADQGKIQSISSSRMFAFSTLFIIYQLIALLAFRGADIEGTTILVVVTAMREYRI
jgi:hypothetical protein